MFKDHGADMGSIFLQAPAYTNSLPAANRPHMLSEYQGSQIDVPPKKHTHHRRRLRTIPHLSHWAATRTCGPKRQTTVMRVIMVERTKAGVIGLLAILSSHRRISMNIFLV